MSFPWPVPGSVGRRRRAAWARACRCPSACTRTVSTRPICAGASRTTTGAARPCSLTPGSAMSRITARRRPMAGPKTKRADIRGLSAPISAPSSAPRDSASTDAGSRLREAERRREYHEQCRSHALVVCTAPALGRSRPRCCEGFASTHLAHCGSAKAPWRETVPSGRSTLRVVDPQRTWRDLWHRQPFRGSDGGAEANGHTPSGPRRLMEAFLVSIGVVALAEIGDKTQLLALVLATRFRRPLPIIAGIFGAPLCNHALAGLAGTYISAFLSGPWMRWALGLSFLAMAVWALIPDKLAKGRTFPGERYGVFPATLISFFLIEIGVQTQIATLALAAQYKALITAAARP